MQVGLVVPQFGKHATKENLLQFVKLAEDEKFESLWVFDRMLCPIEPLQPYPNTPDQKTWPEFFQNVMDPLATLSFIAANTTTPLLGTCIIDMVFHNPVSLAKQFTTIDVLSDGRALCGLGIGWSEDEFKTANIPFKKRGARANEILQVMKKTWTDEIVEFNGEFYTVPKSIIGPKPVQKPHPKILLGGFSPQTFQRMNNYGNGYIGVLAGPFEFFQSMAQSYHQTIEKSTRSENEFEFSALGFPYLMEKHPEGNRMTLTGTMDDIKEDLSKAKDLGVDRVIFGVNLDEKIDVEKSFELFNELRQYCK